MSKKTKARNKSHSTSRSSKFGRFLSVERVIVGGSILGGLLIIIVLSLTGRKTPPDLNLDIPDFSEAVSIEDTQHIPNGEAHQPYTTNPPTSGSHYGSPADWGIYDRIIPDENAIHNLEHGGAWITYQDVGDLDTINDLKDIAERYPSHVILSHRPQNDSAIAVVAWGRILKLDKVDSEQIYNFLARYRFKGPENVG